MEKQMFAVEPRVLQAALDYLKRSPYQDVSEIINGMMSATPIKVQQDAEKPPALKDLNEKKDSPKA